MIRLSILIMKTNFTFEHTHQGEQMLLRDVIQQLGVSKRALTDIKFQGGTLRVNDVEVTVRHSVQPGDVVTIIFPQEKMSDGLIPVYRDLAIVYEDDHVIVVNKPEGLPSIPSRDHPLDSVANRIAGYYSQMNYQATVHMVTRLDRDTSGIILVAKHRHAHHQLSEQMKRDEIIKKYLALVPGKLEPPQGTIEAPIARKSDSIIERQVSASGKYAKTTYQTVEYKKDLDTSLVELRLWTGRTHQIRVHMTYLGHPLLGDSLYGGNVSRISRQALHASAIAFYHPWSKERMEFEVPLPSDMQSVIESR